MPHWESVFGYDYEVPGFVRFLVQKKILEDISYGNDESPSFGVWDPTSDRRVVFWVDHPIGSKRQTPGERFRVQEGNKVFFSTEDLEAALVELYHALGRFHGGIKRSGPKEWRPRTSKMIKEEWEDKLGDVLREYYGKQDRNRLL